MRIDQINLSNDIKEALKDCKDVEKSKIRLEYRNHFKAIALHILKKSCYKNALVQCVKYISHSRILDDESTENIMKLTTFMPFKVSPSIIDEWTLVKATVQIKNLKTFKGRIDDFWTIFFDTIGIDNTHTFPCISKVIKSVLSISHGQADIERGLSQSGLILTDDKTNLGLRTLNARLNIKFTLKLFFEDNHNLVTIDKSFITSARHAHMNYMIYLEECKQRKLEMKKSQMDKEKRKIDEAATMEKFSKEKKSIKVLEEKVKEKEKESHHNARKLLQEANDRLKDAIRKKSLPEISLAQGMIEGAKVMIENEESNTSELLKLKTTVEKRQSALIDNFIKKKLTK